MKNEVIFRDGMPGMPKRITILLPDETGNTAGTAKIYAGYLDEVWVRPDLRGQGIGKSLVMSAIREGATKAIAVAVEMRTILSKLGWASTDGRRFVMPQPLKAA